MRRPDVTIAGGGPAGAAAAIRLARAGVNVTLIERTRAAHDKVCGEFLSATALAELSDIGLALHEPAIERVILIHGARRAEASLPFAAQSLSRAVLDEMLLERAVAAGAEVRRGETFRRVAPPSGALFVATGKHELPGHARGAGARYIGLKQHLRLTAAVRRELARGIALIPLAGGYAGLQPIDGERATLCLAIKPDAFAAAGGTWPALMATMRRGEPQFDGWLAGAEPVQPKPLAVARIPYGFIRRTSDATWWLGDQAAVIPSFAGAGIGLALASARLAADAFLAGASASNYQARFAAFAAPQVRRAQILSQVVMHPMTATIAVEAARHAGGLLTALARGLHPATATLQS